MARCRRRSGTNLPAIRREGVDVKLSENPIFLTHKRLVHRSGVLAAVLIAALIGLCLLLGLAESMREEVRFNNFSSQAEAGKTFYGWTMGVEILVLIIGGFSRISRALADDRKAGLWGSRSEEH